MLRYNWEKINKHCDYNPNKVLTYFKTLIYNKNNVYKGYSYIINPEDLLVNNKHKDEEVYTYIVLASYRIFFDYKVRGDTTLHKYIANALNVDIKNNSLLFEKENIIYFKYEQI